MAVFRYLFLIFTVWALIQILLKANSKNKCNDWIQILHLKNEKHLYGNPYYEEGNIKKTIYLNHKKHSITTESMIE